MDSQSILYRTLFLFAGAFAAAVLTLVAADLVDDEARRAERSERLRRHCTPA